MSGANPERDSAKGCETGQDYLPVSRVISGCHWSYSTSVFGHRLSLWSGSLPQPTADPYCRVATHWSSTTSGTRSVLPHREVNFILLRMSQCRMGETDRRPAVIAPRCWSVRAKFREKWRSTANSWGRRRLNTTGLHRRKVWRTGGLQSSTNGSGQSKMALETLGKAPIGAISQHFFDDFLRVFPRAWPPRRELARIQPRKGLVLNETRRRSPPQFVARS